LPTAAAQLRMLTTLLPALLALYVAEESSMANPTVVSTVGGHKVTHKPAHQAVLAAPAHVGDRVEPVKMQQAPRCRGSCTRNELACDAVNGRGRLICNGCAAVHAAILATVESCAIGSCAVFAAGTP